jgi:diguanylate cyclase (GGDEF)-like protein
LNSTPASAWLSAESPAPAHGEQALAAVLEGLEVAWGVKDVKSGAYREVSVGLAALMGPAGLTPAQAAGRVDAALFPPAAATALLAADHTALAQGRPLLSEHEFELQGRRRAFTVWRVVTAPDAQGRRWMHVAWSNLEAAREREAELSRAHEQLQSLQRALESLRAGKGDTAGAAAAAEARESSLARFDEQLRRELDLSTREHREFAVVLIDVDLQAGPRPVVADAVARLLRDNTRAMDASCRVDDARFAVLLSGVGLATAHARMESLRRQCATQLVVDAGGDAFTVSMGVASFPHTAKTQDGLVGAAERALADARHKGGNRVSLAAIRFDPA